MIVSMRAKMAQLEHNVEVYRRLAFGPQSEKRPLADVSASKAELMQAHLFEAELFEEALRTAELTGSEGTLQKQSEGKPAARKKGGRRKSFPSHLPVYRSTFELPQSERVCSCGGPLHEIGQDLRRELERIELTIVHEIACKKYCCRRCTNGVKTAPGPKRLIDKGILGNGFLTHLLVNRLQNHQPYHRMEQDFASEGLDLGRSVMQRSMSRLGVEFKPIW